MDASYDADTSFIERTTMNDLIYFIGIGGTGMASTAGLAKEKGFRVTGSDSALYPPMSNMLKSLHINVHTPYQESNLYDLNPSLAVIGNSLSRGHCELEFILKHHIKYMSFPEFLSTYILQDRLPIVVAGTHGKTTTTSMLSQVLSKLGYEPGYFIGGIPKDTDRSFRLGTGDYFAIEGDEYDTSCFDKNAKFLHYRPHIIILNSIEFDHADIFSNLEKMDLQFQNLCQMITDPKNIIANIENEGVIRVLKSLKILDKVTAISPKGNDPSAQTHIEHVSCHSKNGSDQLTHATIVDKTLGKIPIETPLIANHDIENFCHVVGALSRLQNIKSIPTASLSEAISSFSGVKRRLEKLGDHKGITIYEDFAHHPTSVTSGLLSLKRRGEFDRILVAFEPKNATSRRRIFLDEYAKSFSHADLAFFGPCPADDRIPVDEKMDLEELCRKTKIPALAYQNNDDLFHDLLKEIKPKDCVVFMSCGSFSNIQHRLAAHISQSEA